MQCRNISLRTTNAQKCTASFSGKGLSLQSLSILGVTGDRQTLKSFFTLSRALYFVFIAIMAEKDVSQRHVVGKRNNILMA